MVRILPALLAGFLLSIPSAPPVPTQEKNGIFSRATRLSREGKNGEALALVKKTLAAGKADKALLLLEGNLLYRLKRYEESIRAFRSAEKAGGGAAAWEGIASAAFAAGRNTQALSAASRALRGGKENLSLLLIGGRAALELERPREGAAWFRRAVLLFPAEASPRSLLARALLEAGLPGEAAALAGEGIKALGPAEGLLRVLAAALLEKGEEGEAADLLEYLARTGLARPADLAALGDLKLRLGLPREALALYRKARAGGLQGKSQVHREALALWSAGDFGLAERKLLSLGPDLPAQWWVEVGRLRLAGKDRPGAIAAFRKALDADPESVPAMLWLGRTALDDGNPDQAEKAFRLLLSRGEMRREAYLGLASVWEKRGDLREALSMLRRARAENPTDPEVLDQVLRLERALDRKEGTY